MMQGTEVFCWEWWHKCVSSGEYLKEKNYPVAMGFKPIAKITVTMVFCFAYFVILQCIENERIN